MVLCILFYITMLFFFLFELLLYYINVIVAIVYGEHMFFSQKQFKKLEIQFEQIPRYIFCKNRYMTIFYIF